MRLAVGDRVTIGNGRLGRIRVLGPPVQGVCVKLEETGIHEWAPYVGIIHAPRPWTCHCCASQFQSVKPQDPNRDLGYGTCDKCRRTAYSPERLAKRCDTCHGISPSGAMCLVCSSWSPSPDYA